MSGCRSIIACLALVACERAPETRSGDATGNGRVMAPTVPVPAHLESLEPAVRNIIDAALAALRRSERNAAAWAGLGAVYQANDLETHAIECYDVAIALAPAEPRWRYWRAMASERVGDIDFAIADMREVRNQAPEYAAASWRLAEWLMSRGDLDDAEAMLCELLAREFSLPAQLNLARLRLLRDDPAGAAQLLEPIRATRPRNPYARRLLGMAYQRLGRENEARVELALGRPQRPSLSDAWYAEIAKYRRSFAGLWQMADGALAAGRTEMALRILEDLRAREPGNVGLLRYLGLTYASLGRVDDGLGTLRDAVEAAPTDAATHVAMAKAHRAAGDADAALAAADRAIKLGAGADAHFLKGVLHGERLAWADAAAEFLRAIALDARNAITRVHVGVAYVYLGRWADAQSAFEAALAQDPATCEAHLGLALTLLQANEPTRAEASARRSVDLPTRDTELFDTLRAMLLDRSR